ncbi:MAG: M56 family metallopeptidase [Shimia sp.]|jgi:beta-lactamase regulating signal transducer with metallopeptidase domain|uniref:M56 family metallopeptidase n=1 Tax=Shimia sp. TaxID=1954381 RepID=UPI00405945A8
MSPGEILLDAFVNANILICVAYLLWRGLRESLVRVGVGQSYGAQLQILNSVFLLIIFSPLITLAYRSLQNVGMAGGVNFNLSDMVVSYYLDGGFAMKASNLEGLMHIRDTFMSNVINGTGWIAQCAIVVFLAGFAIGAMRLVYSMACLRTIVEQSYEWRQFGRVRIRLSDRTLVPFSTRGVWCYYVVLPSHMLTRSHEIKVSIAHELQHIRQGDLEWEIFLEALKPFFFVNPCFHAWKRQVEDLREFSCDSKVLNRGVISVKTYCDTLLSVCQNTLRRDRAFVIAVPKVTLVTADRSSAREGKLGMLESRILSALEQRPAKRQKALFVTAMIPLALALSATTISIQRSADWSQDRLMLSTVVNLERLDEINRLSTFGRIRN